MNTHRNWHRLFGITLLDYFSGSNYEVELEKDLSQQKQLLDVVILKRHRGKSLKEVPDGFSNLAQHNLLTYKSHCEPLDSWALRELVGHYINYRKQVSHRLKQTQAPVAKKFTKLLPESQFRLYAVCTHHPQQLAKKVTLVNIQAGVYEASCFDSTVHIIVTSDIPLHPRNTLWQLFSGVTENFQYAKEHHDWRDAQTSSVVNQLYDYYVTEGVFMPYTLEDYHRDYKRYFVRKVRQNLGEVLEEIPPAEVLKHLSPDDIVKQLSPETLLKQMPVADIEAYLAKSKKPKRQKHH